jgi:hypothetical protein
VTDTRQTVLQETHSVQPQHRETRLVRLVVGWLPSLAVVLHREPTTGCAFAEAGVGVHHSRRPAQMQRTHLLRIGRRPEQPTPAHPDLGRTGRLDAATGDDMTHVFERSARGMSWRCDRLRRAGLPRVHVALYIPTSFTVQAGNRAGRLTAPTLPHAQDPHVEEVPALADRRNRLRPAQAQPAHHSKTMSQQIPVIPAHRSDRPTSLRSPGEMRRTPRTGSLPESHTVCTTPLGTRTRTPDLIVTSRPTEAPILGTTDRGDAVGGTLRVLSSA